MQNLITAIPEITTAPQDDRWSEKLHRLFQDLCAVHRENGHEYFFVKKSTNKDRFYAVVNQFNFFMSEQFSGSQFAVDWTDVNTIMYSGTPDTQQKIELSYDTAGKLNRVFVFPKPTGIPRPKTKKPSVYFAGPDVFRLQARDIGLMLKDRAQENGLIGLYPLDNEVDNNLSRKERARRVYNGNLGMIRMADAIVANVCDFRGKDVDSGTAFEIGFAVALGKPVFMYINDIRSLRNKISHYEDGYDENCLFVEDFGLPVNLMLGQSGPIHESLDAALGAAADYFKVIQQP
jgi:nucleoside 2-deoxyribosyltransferase